MRTLELSVDFNGFVAFDPSCLAAFLGETIVDGTNLWHRFTTTRAGDEVVEQGVVLPVLGIDDGGYEIVVRLADEPSPVADLVIVESGQFWLHVDERAVVADMAVMLEWADDLGWLDPDIGAGDYAVTVRGFREIAAGVVVRCGYELVLEPSSGPVRVTASLETDMQVLRVGA